MKEHLKLTHNGETLTIAGWSKKVGLTPKALRGRLKRGWPLEKALEKSYLKLATKNDAELELNDLPKERLPLCLMDILKAHHFDSKRYGYVFRTFFRKEFDRWFKEEYLHESK